MAVVFLLLAFLTSVILFIAAVAFVMAPMYLHDEAVKRPGSYAPLYLYDRSPYDRIVIEVHYEENARPSTYALEHLQSLVHEYSGKTVDLYEFGDIAPDMLPAVTDRNNFSTFGNGFVDQNAHYRTEWLGGNATIYVLYINVRNGERMLNGSGVVTGMSYRADSFFIFDSYLLDEGLERTVLMHETGHLLGLEHDTDPGCAMVGTLVRNHSVLMGQATTPDDFCEDHQEHLYYAQHHLF